MTEPDVQAAIAKQQWYDASVSGPLRGDALEDFLANYHWLIKLAFTKEDGWPSVVPLWYLWDDGAFWVVGRKRSEWVQDLKRDPRCAICIEEKEIPPAGANRKVIAQCTAEVVEGPVTAEGSQWVEVANRMAEKYVGPEGPAALARSYGWERYLVKLAPRDGRLTTFQGVDWHRRYFDPGQRPDLESEVKPFARSAVEAKRSTIRVLFDAAGQRPDAIRLEVGEPSFRTPAHVVEAAFAAARAGHTRYTPNGGLLSLRELLAERLERVNGYRARPDEIVVTPGGMNALYSIYLALLDPGDEVLLPTPGFPNMDEMVKLVGGTPVFYELRPEEGYLPDPERISALVTSRTKAIFTNSPSNPCGSVFPAATVEALVRLADRHDLWLIADEVYDELILDPDRRHVAARGFDQDGRVVSVYSFSKVYSMTGWRLGYAVAPPALADLLRKLQEPQVSCPSTISQVAAEAALTGPQEVVGEMRDAYRERRDRAWAAIERRGLSAFRTQGTFYMLIDVASAGMPSLDFSLRLLQEADVAVAPGSVFGPAGEGKVRISLAVEAPEIEEGLARLAHMLERG